ncbi:DUF2798 domain-containing protein [Tessaracoccus sp. MC1865]|uniref:DUF2798 domain-containing protein n=1 Tax=Tessaracoccus sp. MC1865 TaxID=2760310 RepID=UPI001600860E|nr:DUF2798 domain-containing protein [Tessaracoccus sp. MC1865]MBB1482448.1 DUF2798 domain-containing protein [Tessaracoccus sp. MC1865]QTO38095.1 DUF2798 domain-containing protein [Tessaracoccus sp. MC1865]
MTKKHALLTQIFMTFTMAAAMSGVMSLIFMGPSLEWLATWPTDFVIAWPIAFLFTMVARPMSVSLAGSVLRRRTLAPAAATSAESAA